MKFLSTWLRNNEKSAPGDTKFNASSMKFLSTWLRNVDSMPVVSVYANGILNEVPEHMAQESLWWVVGMQVAPALSSMKFLSTWLRNESIRLSAGTHLVRILNEVPEHMAQESPPCRLCSASPCLLNEVPEHMAQESASPISMWPHRRTFLNEVPEHMAQESSACPPNRPGNSPQ